MTIIEMQVHMDCSGCENKIRRALMKLEGVDDVDIDMMQQKVTVTGWVEQKKVLAAARRTGRRAVLWPYPYSMEYSSYNQHQPTQAHHHHVAAPQQYYSAPASSYNYYMHGYDNSDVHGQYYAPVYSDIIDEKAGNMFSDENTRGCSIM